MDKPYHVGGDLYLPNPDHYGLPPEHLAGARRLAPFLDILDKRDLKMLPKTIHNMDYEFALFAEDEMRAWAEQSTRTEKELLVKPSGSLQSRLAHRLHQPSHSTWNLRNGEVADLTNPCIAQLSGNVYQEGTLIYDQILRREEKSEASENYPEAVVRCHETFVRKIRESSEAKVEVIHGKAVKDWMNGRPSYRYDMLSLWAEYDGVDIALEHELNFENAQPGHRYRRILVFVRHPNRLFYRDDLESINQDQLMEVAAKIAQVKFVERYYVDQKWRPYVTTDIKNRAIREQYGIPELDSDNSPPPKSRNVERQIGPQDLYLDDKTPSSISESRNLLDTSLKDLRDSTGSLDSLRDLPVTTQAWLKKHNRVLFEDANTISAVDIRKAYDRLAEIQDTPNTKDISLRTMILGLMRQQKASLPNIGQSTLDDLMYCSILPGVAIATKCSRCSTPSQNTQPRWSVNRPDFYAASMVTCYSRLCGGKRAMQIPKDENLRWTPADSRQLKVTQTSRPLRNWKGLLLSDPKQLKSLPSSVNCQCIHDGTKYVDKSPQWAPGDPPKYVEKRTKCKTCITHGRSSQPRYIPEDPDIPSVATRTIAMFCDEWKGQSDEDIRTCFASKPGLPRDPKKFKEQSGTATSKKKQSSQKARTGSAERPLKRVKVDTEGLSLQFKPECNDEDA